MNNAQVYVFIVRPPILGLPPSEKVVLATGADIDDAFENVRVSLGERDFSARCVGAYTHDQLSTLIVCQDSLSHHKVWSALEYVAQEYDMPAKDRACLRRIQDRLLALMLTGEGRTITAK